jgi:superfamily II RNA helicase
MTELLFARGFIKILFCTETMSVGINLPVKTTIFTDVFKFNGEIIRPLLSHEYTQAAGRAGRLGLDTVGHVIHLNNLFKDIDSVNYKLMMNGKPQRLTSKFKISYNLLLNLIDIGDKNLVSFAKKSMVTEDLDNQLKEVNYKMSSISKDLDNFKLYCSNLRTPKTILEQFTELQKNKLTSVNKKRKEIDRQIQYIYENFKFVDQDKISYEKLFIKEKEVNDIQNEIDNINSYIQSGVDKVITLLKNENFIEGDLLNENTINLTIKGKIASQLREIHCLIFADLIDKKKLDVLTTKQLVSLFSCFTNVSVPDDYKDFKPNSENEYINTVINTISIMYSDYQKNELLLGIQSGSDYNIHYDLLKYTDEWCDAQSVNDCKLLLQKIGTEKGIFLGEFVKALLKINNISNEMEKIAELTGNIAFLSKLKEIKAFTLKYVVTNQSLYV